MNDAYEQPRLCFVSNPWAWFTTQSLAHQWGDDWSDAPYEHNAGWPYEWHDGRDAKPWALMRLAYAGDFRVPSDGHLNSPYSVRGINSGAVPWLVARDQPDAALYAGATVTEFAQFVLTHDGTVWFPVTRQKTSDAG